MLVKLVPWLKMGQLFAQTDTGRNLGKRAGWSFVQWAAALGSGLMAKKAVEVAWVRVRGDAPPENPADPGVDWGEAIGWSVAIGVGYGVGRVAGRRLAAAGWEKALGEAPPGYGKDAS